MASRCYTRLVGTVVVIGADESSGLVQQFRSRHDQSDEVAEEAYQAHIVSTFTESQAFYTFRCIQTDPHYPPLQFKDEVPLSPLPETQTEHEDKDCLSRYHTSHRRFTIWRKSRGSESGTTARPSIKRSIPLNTTTLNASVREPFVRSETVNGLPTLCYPNGLKVIGENQFRKVEIKILGLTNIKGERLYAVGLSMYRRFRSLGKDDDGSVILKLEEYDYSDYKEHFVFVPCTVLLLCQHSYFSVLREALSVFHREIQRDETDFENILSNFTASVTNTVIPSSDSVAFQVEMFDHHFIIPPPLPMTNQIIDFDLTLLFQFLSINDIIFLVTALLMQRRVVVVSSNPVVTALCCETLLLLLNPFVWKFTYIPYLPPVLMEVIDAPGPFILGCDVAYKADVEQVEDVVIADLEHRCVASYSDLPIHLPPQWTIETLRESISHVLMNFDQFSITQTQPLSMDEERERKWAFIFANQQIITQSFLHFMVNIFRGINQHIHNKLFNMDGFLKTQTDAKEFYASVTKTELFDFFLRSRFSSNPDCWSLLERRTRRNASNASLTRNSTTSETSSHLFSEQENVFHQRSTASIARFSLPSSTTPHVRYFQKFVSRLTEEIESAATSQIKASYLVIRSDIYFHQSKKVEALKDAYELSQTDVQLLDKEKIIHITDNLSKKDFNKIKRLDFFENLRKIVGFGEKKVTDDVDRIQKTFQMPIAPIGFNDFFELLHNAEISTNTDVQEKLFRLLTLDEQQTENFCTVNHELFAVFYNFWELNAESTATGAGLYQLEHDEVILKISAHVRVDPISIGFLIVTAQRLLFVPLGSGTPKEIFLLNQIRNIKQSSARVGIFGAVDTLIVEYERDTEVESYVFWLKNDTKIWKHLLTEIWSAQLISAESKDLTLLADAIDNFLILDNLYSCSQADPYFHKHLNKMIEKMTSFSAMSQPDFQLSDLTREALVIKLDPNPRHRAKKSVEGLIFDEGDCESGIEPRLWCAYNDQSKGHVVIFDVLNYVFQSEVLSINSKVTAVLLVSGKTVWVSALDGKIYVVDAVKMVLVQELVEHRQFVLCLALSENGDTVASGSVHGEVCLWNTTTKQKQYQWLSSSGKSVVSLLFYSDKLYCNLRSSIHVHSCCGELLHAMNLDDVLPQRESLPVLGFECMNLQNGFLYVGLNRQSRVLVYDLRETLPQMVTMLDIGGECRTIKRCLDCPPDPERCQRCKDGQRCRGLSRLVCVGAEVWACCKDGNIFINQLNTGQVLQHIRGHSDTIAAACSGRDQLVFTGARSDDGKIAVWNVMQDSQL